MTEHGRKRIAHMAGPTATVQNSPPLVTSNKERDRLGLALRLGRDGKPLKYDALRPQRLAAPAKVYVEQHSAHPLESDAAHLYGPPHGYIHADGTFATAPTDETARPVYEIALDPADGLYPLPYMATQADGTAWEDDGAFPGAPADKARQSFFPNGARSFDEIDRIGINDSGTAGLISELADVDFHRVLPPAGYTQGLPQQDRSDISEGDIDHEKRGRDFFAYRPYHLSVSPPRTSLAQITNRVQAIADSGQYDGLLWTQGSPQIEETLYWFNLLIDTNLPICGCAAQRAQGEIGADGPKNIVDSVAYLTSDAWQNEDGHNRCGTVLLQEQQIFAAREVTKVDARPGGYRATGGHGGILGQVTHKGKVWIPYVPAYRHTATSEVSLSKMPASVEAVVRGHDGRLTRIPVVILEGPAKLSEAAIPSVSIIKEPGYSEEAFDTLPDERTDILARIEHKLALGRLSGFVAEGLVPYGHQPSRTVETLIQRAIFSGIPVVRVGRGAPEGFTDHSPYVLAGSNLTATKARLVLMACLMRFGALPTAVDPTSPTDDERAATRQAVAECQRVFDTH
ncbi:hypothetical protein ASD83_04580 [Devosia sp. Root685]|uniref:asparaginase domain-containing protein n=1 Tax=Devosia sp. Root685 TaxID=1736587 RepID=UPI0006F45947|nr:asparaginase domain-containing protein [Devosia sp. Root685]KRA99781.1 hypothetical protein ASD83_04580 [Devosia sp. Root685]